MWTQEIRPGTIGSLLSGASSGQRASKTVPAALPQASDVLERAAGLAAAFLQYGAEPGQRLALMAQDGAESLLAEVAAQIAGLVVVPIDPGTPDARLRRLLLASEARIALVADVDVFRRLQPHRPELPALDLILLFEAPGGERVAPASTVDQAVRSGERLLADDPAGIARVLARTEPATPCRFTIPDGSTGCARLRTHANVASAVEGLARAMPLDGTDRVLVALPWTASAARALQLHALASGASLAFVPNGATLGDAIRAARTTVVVTTRTAVEAWAVGARAAIFGGSWPARALAGWTIGRASARFDAARAELRMRALTGRERWIDALTVARPRGDVTGGALRSFVSIGPPLEDGVARFLFGLDLACFEGAVADEVMGLVSVAARDGWYPGSAGRPVPGLEVQVAPNGCLRVRGRMVATNPGTSPEAWVETTLSARVDPSGSLHLA